MSSELKFLNDIARPWDELNNLLIQRYAFQPDLSSITLLVTSLSNAIKHQVDILAIEQNKSTKKLQKQINQESQDARIISDVSDAAKHVQLHDSNRQNNIYVAAMFEVNSEDCFRFLRNTAFIEHKTLGEYDFMQTSLNAINYWIKKRNLNITWSSKVLEANNDYFPTAFLIFESKYCLNMTSMRLKLFKRDSNNSLQPFDHKEVHLEILSNN